MKFPLFYKIIEGEGEVGARPNCTIVFLLHQPLLLVFLSLAEMSLN
jgi:hypothetical protein